MYLCPVDVTAVDFSKTVVIDPTGVEVYGQTEDKPKKGEALNQPALVTLF
jgi:hypothetical protein